MLEMDHFKGVNDQHSHADGDRLLKAMGRWLQDLTQPGHLVARSGGEVFCIMTPDTTMAEVNALAERIREHCTRSGIVSESGAKVQFTVSAGVHLAEPAESLEHVLAIADRALYEAKRKGRNQIQTSTFGDA